MQKSKKFIIEDKQGNNMYPATFADVVFTEDGGNVAEKLKQIEGATPNAHTHTKSQITDFAHTHTKSQITDFAHTHTKSEISDFPTSLPANGGNADTVDGKHASDFPLKSQGIGGNAPIWNGSNLNDIPIGTYTTLSTGVPVSGEYFIVTTRYNDTGKIKEQYALRQGNGERYFRWFNSKSWSEWKNLDDYAPSHKSANGYWGICPVKGDDTGWIRTPSLGLLPYASGGGASSSNLGTSSWKFKEIHGVNIFANGVNVGTELNNLKSSLKNSGGIKSVQSGRYGYSGSADNHTVKISAVNVSKSFVLVNCPVRMNSTNTGLGYGYLENSTNLILKFPVESSYNMTVAWQVIEFY